MTASVKYFRIWRRIVTMWQRPFFATVAAMDWEASPSASGSLASRIDLRQSSGECATEWYG